MSLAASYLENLQGLILFLLVKRNHNATIQEIFKLSPSVREDLENDYLAVRDELLEWHEERNQIAINYLSETADLKLANDSQFFNSGNQKEERKEQEDYIESIRNHPTPTLFQDKITFQIIETLSKDILSATSELNIPINSIPVFGTLHTEQVNACAIKIPKSNEYIVAFESQLFHFLNRFTKILVQAFDYKGENEGNFQLSVDINDVKKNIKTKPAIQELFNELIWAYVIEGDVKKAQNWMLDYPRYIMATYLLNCTELFIMGHEYGHIAKGHLEQNLSNKIKLSNTEGYEVNPKWEMEFDADSIGLFLSMRVLNKKGFQEDFTLIGGELHFIISDVVCRAFSIIKYGHEEDKVHSNSHPPAKMRRENIRKSLRIIFNEDQMKSAEFFPTAVENIMNHLWEGSKQMFYDYYNSKR